MVLFVILFLFNLDVITSAQMNPFLDHIKDVNLDDKHARKEFIKTAMTEIRADVERQQYEIDNLKSFFLKSNFLLLHSAVKIEMQRRNLKTLDQLLTLQKSVIRKLHTQLDISDKEIQRASSIIRAQRRIISSYNIPEEEDEL